MTSNIKLASDLTDNEIHKLFAVYEHAFKKKGLNTRDFPQWRNELELPFCYTGDPRMMHVYGDSGDNPYGYLMLTKPSKIGDENVSKIIQGGIGAIDPSKRGSEFENMVKELLETNQDTRFFAEIGIEHEGLVKLFENVGFQRAYNKQSTKNLVTKLITDRQYELIDDKYGYLIGRHTLMEPDYKGFLLISPTFETSS